MRARRQAARSSALGYAYPVFVYPSVVLLSIEEGLLLTFLQSPELLACEGALVYSSPASQAEEEALTAREARWAAATFGLPPSRLSEMEATCLAPLLTSPARVKRVVGLRNEILRRQRSKIDEGGMEVCMRPVLMGLN